MRVDLSAETGSRSVSMHSLVCFLRLGVPHLEGCGKYPWARCLTSTNLEQRDNYPPQGNTQTAVVCKFLEMLRPPHWNSPHVFRGQINVWSPFIFFSFSRTFPRTQPDIFANLEVKVKNLLSAFDQIQTHFNLCGCRWTFRRLMHGFLNECSTAVFTFLEKPTEI